jgi:murein L,D-transpeptidase YafK
VALLKRPFARTLLASAAVIAAVALAGCDADSISPTGRAQAPLSEKLLAEMSAKNMDKDSPMLARIFKEEAEMEVWKKNRDGEYALLKTYPICKWSGDLGPKKKVGDRQAPEGFYTITPGQMNPNSNYYLAFNTGFPNAYDRAWGYTGSDLMVHGDCSSRGCYAMTDEQIQEIYALARESFFGGQKAFQLQAYPFRMTAMNMAKHRNNPNFAFWKMLKEGYDHFNASHQEPKVAVCEKRYVFDAAQPDDSTKPLSFNAKGACPVYQLDKTIADAVYEERRQEQLKMAQYIASGVPTVPFRVGDGGMNPVFMAKLPSTSADNSGRLFELASAPSVDAAAVPGALPRTPNRGAVTLAKLQSPRQPSGPATVASVPMPHAAPQPKEGETPVQQAKPTSIAGLIGEIFGGSKSEAAPTSPPPKEQVAARSTDLAAKPKQAAPVHTASAPARPATPPTRTASAGSSPWPSEPATAPAPAVKPTADAASAPKPTPVQQPAKVEAPEIRTAYTTPPASSNGLLAGAQPVVPTGSFETRWSGMR